MTAAQFTRAHVAELKASQPSDSPRGHEEPSEAATQLTELLCLESVRLHVVGARVVGRGGTASADLRLSDGSEITFDPQSVMLNPAKLAGEIAFCTGATPSLKAPQALKAASLIRALAQHEATTTKDDAAFDWGASFLQEATVLDVALDDQAERWGAFVRLGQISPWGMAQQVGGTVAQHSVVLRDASSQERLVRASWFHTQVRSRENRVGAPEVAARMGRVGWTRRGTRGRIKASRPGFKDTLAFAFHVVSSEWEHRDDRSGAGVPVSAGVLLLRARVLQALRA